MKSYTYLDQAPLLEVDVHEGLENTLVIMQHKLKQGVQIKREYSANLPRIEAYASELNQVWTNIIDNAIDAMNGKGEITLRPMRKIIMLLSRSWTTDREFLKKFGPASSSHSLPPSHPAKGRGWVCISRMILLSNRHHGQLLVELKAGGTKFKVILPVRMNKSAV